MRTLISIPDLMDIFQVTQMSIWRYRKMRELDAHLIIIPGRKRDVLRYDLTGVLRWAKIKGIQTPGLKDWQRANPKTMKI